MRIQGAGLFAFAASLAVAWVCGCAAAPPKPSPAHSAGGTATASEAGSVDRSEVEALPKWQEARARVHADPGDAHALASVPPGATLRIYLGTWCGDSRREVSRFWHALDQAGQRPPFDVELISVDRTLTAAGGLTDGAGLRYVPTFVVLRNGQEVGRIVESPESTIGRDLAALLSGERRGVVTGRSNL